MARRGVTKNRKRTGGARKSSARAGSRKGAGARKTAARKRAGARKTGTRAAGRKTGGRGAARKTASRTASRTRAGGSRKSTRRVATVPLRAGESSRAGAAGGGERDRDDTTMNEDLLAGVEEPTAGDIDEEDLER